ncbi:hypothetical protein ZWY2020_011669 [Hordeum vulgare]|nr:hypothetical protein ZWY2020_011669 [Hordeum vulgare]
MTQALASTSATTLLCWPSPHAFLLLPSRLLPRTAAPAVQHAEEDRRPTHMLSEYLRLYLLTHPSHYFYFPSSVSRMGIAATEDPKEMKNHQHPVDEMEMKVVKFSRGKAANLAWFLPVEGGYLEPEGLEKTYRFSQHQLRDGVDILNSRKPFDIILPELGPYTLEYTSNGRYMIVGGRKGHIGMMDMLSMDLIKEFQVRETVRDVAFLHNEQLFAVAQKKYPYIYNRHGTEIHCLKEHGKALKLQFLDKHFLLASINSFGQLHYQDMSTA